MVGWSELFGVEDSEIGRREGGLGWVGFDDMRVFFPFLLFLFSSLPGSVSKLLFSLEYLFPLCIDFFLGFSRLLLSQEEEEWSLQPIC